MMTIVKYTSILIVACSLLTLFFLMNWGVVILKEISLGVRGSQRANITPFRKHLLSCSLGRAHARAEAVPDPTNGDATQKNP